MRKENFRLVFSTILMFFMLTGWVHAENTNTPQEPREHVYKDMLMLFLSPHIQKAVNEYYAKLLTQNPMVYPYQVEVVKAERIDGMHFSLVVETTPVVGPHISVGLDRLTFEIDPTIPDDVKLIKFEHLKTHELPDHWKHIIRRP